MQNTHNIFWIFALFLMIITVSGSLNNAIQFSENFLEEVLELNSNEEPLLAYDNYPLLANSDVRCTEEEQHANAPSFHPYQPLAKPPQPPQLVQPPQPPQLVRPQPQPQPQPQPPLRVQPPQPTPHKHVRMNLPPSPQPVVKPLTQSQPDSITGYGGQFFAPF